MAEFQHKNGSFSLFKNSYKQDGDNKPDYKGKGKDLAGNDIEIAAWLRDGKDGGPRWLSCQAKLKGADQQASPQQQRTPAQDALAEIGEKEAPRKAGGNFAQMDDDIPFMSIARPITGHVI